MEQKILERFAVLLSIKKVANELGLSESYVGRVVREDRKRRTLGVIGDSISLKNNPAGREYSEKREDAQVISDLGITKTDLMIIYHEFRSGKTPPDIIALYGYHPDIVLREYGKFNTMRGIDISKIQSDILYSISAEYFEELIPYYKSFKQRGFLFPSEIQEALLTSQNQNYGEDQRILLENIREPAPNGWVKLPSKDDRSVAAIVRASDEYCIIPYHKTAFWASAHANR